MTKPMTPTIEQLERALRIDEHDLNTACAEQPVTFYEVAKQLALTISRRDACKQSLQEIEAKADADIRHDASVDGEKVTVDEVKSRKILDGDVMKAQRALLDLNKQCAEWAALKDAFQQRGYVLRDLIQLYMSRYYGDPEHMSSRVKTVEAATAREALNRQRRSTR